MNARDFAVAVLICIHIPSAFGDERPTASQKDFPRPAFGQAAPDDLTPSPERYAIARVQQQACPQGADSKAMQWMQSGIVTEWKKPEIVAEFFKSDREKLVRDTDRTFTALMQKIYLQTGSSREARRAAKNILIEHGCDEAIIDDFSIGEVVAFQPLGLSLTEMGKLPQKFKTPRPPESVIGVTENVTRVPEFRSLQPPEQNSPLNSSLKPSTTTRLNEFNITASLASGTTLSPKFNEARWANHDKPSFCRKLIQATESACSAGSLRKIVSDCGKSADRRATASLQAAVTAVGAAAAVASLVLDYLRYKQDKTEHDENRLDTLQRENSNTQSKLVAERNNHGKLEVREKEIQEARAKSDNTRLRIEAEVVRFEKARSADLIKQMENENKEQQNEIKDLRKKTKKDDDKIDFSEATEQCAIDRIKILRAEAERCDRPKADVKIADFLRGNQQAATCNLGSAMNAAEAAKNAITNNFRPRALQVIGSLEPPPCDPPTSTVCKQKRHNWFVSQGYDEGEKEYCAAALHSRFCSRSGFETTKQVIERTMGTGDAGAP